MLGFVGKPYKIEPEVLLATPGGGIEITDAGTVTDALEDPTATFEGSAEAVVRLLTGRLTAQHADG